MSTKLIPVVVTGLIIAFGTYLQGQYTDRWGKASSEKLGNFSSRLDNVPRVFDEWTSVDTEVDAEQFKASNCDKAISRIYTSSETGEEVSVFLVSGTARHVTIHTPDWCYVGAGFEMEGQPHPYIIECESLDIDPEFQTTTFTKRGTLRDHSLRIFWSFTDDGDWQGPRSAKTEFAGRKALYKIYLITTIDNEGRDPEDAASRDFARRFIPILNQVFFAETNAETLDQG